MNHKPHTMETLSRQVADHMGEGAPANRRVDKQAVLRRSVAASKRARSASYGWRIGFAAAASVAVILAAVSVWRMGPSPVDYWVGNELAASAPGRWIKAPNAGSMPVRFENGDNLELQTQAAVRIIASNDETISVALDSGLMTARINEEHGSQFSVKAGPYWIYDIGTVFSVDWNPQKMALLVQVEEGLVHIVGNTLAEDGVRVAAGDVFQYPPKDQALAATLKSPAQLPTGIAEIAPVSNEAQSQVETDAPAPAAGQPQPDVNRRSVRRSSKSESPKGVPSAKPAPTQPEWAAHLSRNDYSRAVKAAQGENLGQLAQQVSQKDLWELAQAARYAREGHTAKRLLQFYRERFAQTAQANTAAFLIGRVEMELLGDQSSAAKWFETYLRQAPGGDLVEETLGRLMQIYQKLERTAENERTARLYRQKYPDGLYKRLASSILNE